MIYCKKVKIAKTVCYGSLKVGDTFLYASKPCIVADRCGQSFPIAIETGAFMASINSETQVVPIECELTFYIK